MTFHTAEIAAPAAALTEDVAPRWLQIAQALRADILAGHLAPGMRLPNETELARRFSVHRHTLRQAVARLAQEGHVRVMQGRGTFVRELVLDYALQRRTRLTENLAEAGERAQRRLLAYRREPAGEWGPLLHLPPLSPVEVLVTLASARGRPIGLSTSVHPSERCAGIAEAFADCQSLTEAMRRVGVVDYQRAHSTVSARLPTAQEADVLARPVTEPVLVVQFTSLDTDGVPVQAGRTLFAADAVQLSVNHPA